MSQVEEYYDGKKVLITGGSGFMGKVLVEKLLYSCAGLHTVFLLLRAKKGKNPQARLDEIFSSLVFKRVKEEFPERMKKVVVVDGDLTKDGMDLSPSNREMLLSQVDVVFHGAATLRLDSKLKEAINMNVAGTLRLLELASQMKNLKVFVHLSTAFCHVDHVTLEERIYPAPVDPHYLIELTKWMDDETFELITPKLMHPHPNSYTYSKRLAEIVVNKFYPKLPLVIIRPSIVCPALKEPMAGWVDNINGPVGILIGAGKGAIRSMMCHEECFAEVMPVDYAINGLLVISSVIGRSKQRRADLPVYNLTQGKTNTATWGQILEMGRKENFENPFEIILWYPNGNIRRNKNVHDLCVLLFHWVPAYLIDGLMFIIQKKPFMVKLQRRIQDGLAALQYFTTRHWDFKNEQLLAIREEMNDQDKQKFPLDFESAEPKAYIRDCILGARHYFLKEDPASLPRSRIKMKIYWAVDRMVTVLFWLLMAWLLVSYSNTARSALDSVINGINSIPFLRSIK